MKNIFVIICSIIIPVFSLNEITPKLCVNCKFFMKNVISGNTYGKCSFFPKTEMNIDLVTGIKTDSKYHYCSIARDYDDMCGKQGKQYVHKLDNYWHFATLWNEKKV